MRLTAFLLAFTLSLPIQSMAQDKPGEIVVTGFGRVTAPAEKARLEISAIGKAQQTGPALDSLSDTMDGVLTTLRAYGVAEEDIETERLSLEEDWERIDEKRTFIGYEANSGVEVDVRDLERIGNLITTISQNSNATIRGPFFDVEDNLALRDEARRKAVLDGVATARLLAEAAGVTLGPPLLITDGTETPYDHRNRSSQFEEPMRMEEPLMESFGESVDISQDGVSIIPSEITRVETVVLIFRIDP